MSLEECLDRTGRPSSLLPTSPRSSNCFQTLDVVGPINKYRPPLTEPEPGVHTHDRSEQSFDLPIQEESPGLRSFTNLVRKKRLSRPKSVMTYPFSWGRSEEGSVDRGVWERGSPISLPLVVFPLL